MYTDSLCDQESWCCAGSMLDQRRRRWSNIDPALQRSAPYLQICFSISGVHNRDAE